MKPFAVPRRQRGFSLLELALGLVAMGLVGAVAWALVARMAPLAGGETIAARLLVAEHAVQGFALARHRLPCPDRDDDGSEDCAAASIEGRLPWRTLGLPRDALRYGVHRAAVADADLAAAVSRFSPTLPVDGALANLNGLDFCIGLRNAQRSAAFGGLAGGLPVAYVLADPGRGDGNADGSLFDAVGGSFALPGTPATAASDDHLQAVGFSELATRLGCGQRLGALAGAVRSAAAAADLVAYADGYVQFRSLVEQVRRTARDLAIASLVLASADLAIAVATGVTSVALALASATGSAAAIGAGAGAAIAVAAATAAVVAAGVSVAMAENALNVATTRLGEANTFRSRAVAERDALRTRAATLDQAGLLR